MFTSQKIFSVFLILVHVNNYCWPCLSHAWGKQISVGYANHFPLFLLFFFYSSDMARECRAVLGHWSPCWESACVGSLPWLVKTKKNVKNTIQHALKFRLQAQCCLFPVQGLNSSNTVPVCVSGCVVWLQYFLKECVCTAKQNTSLWAACALQCCSMEGKSDFIKTEKSTFC